METLDFGVQSEFNIRFSTSPVFECALGIAAFTRDEIHDKLDRSIEDLRSMGDRMTEELRREVSLAGEVHSWRNLLFLAHRCPLLSDSPWEQHIHLFVSWIQENEQCLTELAAPFLGVASESELKDALSGNVLAQQNLLQIYSDNPVVHLNLRYLFSIESHTLTEHLINLLECWFNEFVCADASQTMRALQLDEQFRRQQMAEGMKPPQLIRTVTRGNELQPTPGVQTLWLIPQSVYRPFTILNYLPNTVVYYYPLADEFLPGGSIQTQMVHVASLHKALGDVQRIRLLNQIRLSPKSLAELTNTLNATKSNLHHHLALLRSSGLVEVEDGVYSMNQDAILRVGDELRALLNL